MIRKTIFILTIWTLGSLPLALMVGRLLSQMDANKLISIPTLSDRAIVLDRKVPDAEILNLI